MLKTYLLIFLFSFNAFALSPEEKLEDPKLEQRANEMFLEVRCIVCGGQVIENSDSEFSFQMRKNIRQKIAAGKTDEEIKDELISEFGEDILTRPSGKNRIILFGLPLIFAIFAAQILRLKKASDSQV